MKAALIDRYGSNDLVKVVDIAVPVMGPMDLLIHVHAAGVNPVDVKTRDGEWKAGRQPTGVDSRGQRWRWKRGHPVGPSPGRDGFHHGGATQCGTGEASGRGRPH